MDESLFACRFVQFTAAIVVFGVAAFRVYALAGTESSAATGLLARFDARFDQVMLSAAMVAVISAMAFVFCQAATMAGSPAAAFDLTAAAAVLFDTRFGRVWCWHILIAAALVFGCLGRNPKRPVALLLSLALIGSFGWVGHAAIGDAGTRIVHQLNQMVHLLAGGLWLGGLAPLAWVLRHSEFSLAQDALRNFSRMGYFAVALVAMTGVMNTFFLVGNPGAMFGTAYGRLLALKILLFLAMVAIASVNRFRLARGISDDPGPFRALCVNIAIEQTLGLAVLAVVSVLGTRPPGL
jgi:putative copper resistance protein D